MIEFKLLHKTPNETLCNSHYYCDYLELLALVDCDDGLSINDIYDRFLEDNKISDIGTENGSINNEEWMGRISGWFEEINCRISHYGNNYPFTYDGNRIKKINNITHNHYIYILLLLCSSLKYLNGYHSLTTLFEQISFASLKKYLPNNAEVHVFGVSSERNARYFGSIEQKYSRLAQDLGLTRSTRPNVFRDRDNGDGGVDIVAWIPFRDDPNLDRKQIFLGQSASGKNWSYKQASVDRVKNYIMDLPSNAQNILFVPYDFRDSNRYFCQNDEITASLIFDRHRIIKLIDINDINIGAWVETIQRIIDYALSFEEDII
ncbi:hypothetical protein ACN0AB_004767 [Escherichia coli]|nr:Uncharacterised protein [Escherichia coli]HAH9071646.1 hypothetical protein [Escherichia coli]HAI0074477.1 hypothetical protein [Escherichia coli]